MHITCRPNRLAVYFSLFSSSVTAPLNKKRAWSWPAYLEEERAVAAPVKLFKEVQTLSHHLTSVCFTPQWSIFLNFAAFVLQHQSLPQSRNSFKVGMKMEGLDPSHPSLFCVLTVAEVQVPLKFGLLIREEFHSLFHVRGILSPRRSKVTESDCTLTVTPNATTSGPTPTRGI